MHSASLHHRHQRWVFIYAIPWVLNLLFVQAAFFSSSVFFLTFLPLVIVALVRLWQNPPKSHKGITFFGLLMLIGSTVFSLSPWRSLEWIMLNLFPALLFWFAWKDESIPSKLLILPYLTVAFLAFLGASISLYTTLQPWIAARTWPFQALRVTASPLRWHPNQFAHFIAVGFPLFMALHIAGSSKEARFAQVLMFISFIFLVFTNSRGGLLAWGIGVVSFLILNQSHKQTIFQPRWLWKITLLLGLLLFLWQSRLRLGNVMRPDFSNGRIDFWKWGVRAWRQQPIWGQGPGTWPLIHLASTSVPPRFFTDMPHNLIVDLLTSTGLLGLAWSIAALRQLLRQKRPWPLWQRAALAAGLSWFAHHMVDETIHWGAWNLIPVTLLLMLCAKNTSSFEKQTYTPKPIIWAFLWRGLATGTLVFIILHGASLYLYERGRTYGAQGQWAQAGFWMERAARLAFWEPGYTVAAAYAYGKHALTSTLAKEERNAFLRRSADLFEKSLDQEPQYAVHWANYAWILWNLGRRNEARKAMTQAVQRAPLGPFSYSLAWMEERMGDIAKATSLYITFLDVYPWFSYSPSFTSNVQTNALQRWVSRKQPRRWFTWEGPLYQTLLDNSFEMPQRILFPPRADIPSYRLFYINKYFQTFLKARQKNDKQAKLFAGLTPPLSFDMHLWLISQTINITPTKHNLIQEICLRLKYNSSYGAAWEISNKNFSILYRIPPPDILDLLPGFPLPLSPVFPKICAS